MSNTGMHLFVLTGNCCGKASEKVWKSPSGCKLMSSPGISTLLFSCKHLLWYKFLWTCLPCGTDWWPRPLNHLFALYHQLYSLTLILALTPCTGLSAVTANFHHQVKWLFLSSCCHWHSLALFWRSFFPWCGSLCTLLFLPMLFDYSLIFAGISSFSPSWICPFTQALFWVLTSHLWPFMIPGRCFPLL